LARRCGGVACADRRHGRRFSDARTDAGSRKTLGETVLEKDDEYFIFKRKENTMD